MNICKSIMLFKNNLYRLIQCFFILIGVVTNNSSKDRKDEIRNNMQRQIESECFFNGVDYLPEKKSFMERVCQNESNECFGYKMDPIQNSFKNPKQDVHWPMELRREKDLSIKIESSNAGFLKNNSHSHQKKNKYTTSNINSSKKLKSILKNKKNNETRPIQTKKNIDFAIESYSDLKNLNDQISNIIHKYLSQFFNNFKYQYEINRLSKSIQSMNRINNYYRQHSSIDRNNCYEICYFKTRGPNLLYAIFYFLFPDYKSAKELCNLLYTCNRETAENLDEILDELRNSVNSTPFIHNLLIKFFMGSNAFFPINNPDQCSINTLMLRILSFINTNFVLSNLYPRPKIVSSKFVIQTDLICKYCHIMFMTFNLESKYIFNLPCSLPFTDLEDYVNKYFTQHHINEQTENTCQKQSLNCTIITHSYVKTLSTDIIFKYQKSGNFDDMKLKNQKTKQSYFTFLYPKFNKKRYQIKSILVEHIQNNTKYLYTYILDITSRSWYIVDGVHTRKVRDIAAVLHKEKNVCYLHYSLLQEKNHFDYNE